MSFPPSVVRLGVSTVDDGQSRSVVAGADYLGHVTELTQHVLHVPHQHRQSGGHLREPRLQALVAGLHAPENARRGGACPNEELLGHPPPQSGPLVASSHAMAVPAKGSCDLVWWAVQQAGGCPHSPGSIPRL